MLEVSFDVMQSAALAALVAMVGRGIVKRVKFFQTYCIPGVIVAGLIVSFILGILRSAGLLSVHFEVTVLKEWFMDIFFTGVGLTASWALIKKGGKVCIGITITTIGLILGQDILGVALAVLLGMHPLHGLGLGSLSLMGGVGTSSAIAPSYEALGAENAVVLAVMCATFGMVFASLCGGPVARTLIKRHRGRRPSEWEVPAEQRMSHHRIRRTGLLHRHPGRQSPLYRISLLHWLHDRRRHRPQYSGRHPCGGPDRGIGRIWRSVP